MDKKGIAIGVTTIVIVVIALLVLIVVVAAFSGQFGGFGRAVRDCESKGGYCKLASDGCDADETRYFGVGLCRGKPYPDENGVCCISLTGTEGKKPVGASCTSDSQCENVCDYESGNSGPKECK